MSQRFRDLEKPNPERRKDIVLMAAVSGFESLPHPDRQDLVQFSALFPKLFENASAEARRTASAALSKIAYVPDEIVELIIDQPIEIAAPFICHYRELSEAALARAVMRHGTGHARAAARRADLSAEGLAALRALGDPHVDRALALRNPAADREESAPTAGRALAADVPPLAELDQLHATDPGSEALRDRLRDLASGRESRRGAVNDGIRVRNLSQLLTAARDFASDADRAAFRRQNHLERLSRFAGSGDAVWFATALADAMGSSYSLAERIMLDLSGRQLAATMLALGAPDEDTVTSLRTYFPHLGDSFEGRSKAERVLAGLDRETSLARLEAWLRADGYTFEEPVEVPSLDEDDKAAGEPLPEPSNDRVPRTVRRSA